MTWEGLFSKLGSSRKTWWRRVLEMDREGWQYFHGICSKGKALLIRSAFGRNALIKHSVKWNSKTWRHWEMGWVFHYQSVASTRYSHPYSSSETHRKHHEVLGWPGDENKFRRQENPNSQCMLISITISMDKNISEQGPCAETFYASTKDLTDIKQEAGVSFSWKSVNSSTSKSDFLSILIKLMVIFFSSKIQYVLLPKKDLPQFIPDVRSDFFCSLLPLWAEGKPGQY